MGDPIDDDGTVEVQPRRRRRRRLGTALSMLSALVLTVSAGAATTNLAQADRTPAPTTTTTTAPPATTTTVAPVPGQARPAPAGTYAVTVSDCRQNGSDLRIWGAVANRGDEPTAYRVAATATAPSGELLLTGYAETEVVPPAEERPWLLETSWADDLVAIGATCGTGGVEVLNRA